MEPFQRIETNTPKEPEPEYRSTLKPMRTFSTDLAKAVREKGGSVVRIAIAEEEKHREDFELANRQTQKKYLLMSVGLIVVTIGIIFGLYFYKKTTQEKPVIQESLPSSVILSEYAQKIDATDMQVSDLLDAVHTVVANPNIREGTIKNIVITQGTGPSMSRISSTQFLTVIAHHAPLSLLSAINKEYMLGIYQYQTSDLFVVIRGTAHDFLQGGMLDWEPYLLEDLAPLFNIENQAHNYRSTRFVDALIENRDARAVVDINNKPVIFYSFVDPNTILIAKDPKALSESVRRY